MGALVACVNSCSVRVDQFNDQVCTSGKKSHTVPCGGCDLNQIIYDCVGSKARATMYSQTTCAGSVVGRTTYNPQDCDSGATGKWYRFTCLNSEDELTNATVV